MAAKFRTKIVINRFISAPTYILTVLFGFQCEKLVALLGLVSIEKGPHSDLILVTNITTYICGEKLSFGEISAFHV